MPTLIANKKLKANGEQIAPGATFTIDDNERAAVLVRVGSARPASSDEVGSALATDASLASRRANRPAGIPTPRRQPEPIETVPRIENLRRIAKALPGAAERDLLVAVVELLDATERRLAAVEGKLAARTARAPE